MARIPGMEGKLYIALHQDIMVARIHTDTMAGRITGTDGGVRGIIIMIMVITGMEGHIMCDGSMIPAISRAPS